jgi:hypothetical protein
MKRCTGVVGLIFGHQFIATYNRRVERHFNYGDESEETEYRGDVCERCGVRVNAEQPKGAERIA